MYIFVFLWVPFLQEAAPSDQTLPLGYIFSCFMLSMTLGALLYNCIISLSHPTLPTEPSSHDHTVTLHAKFSSAICTASALTFVLSISTESEHKRFWSFCAFEACVGMYYPVQGMLRGKLVPDEHRATVSVSSLLDVDMRSSIGENAQLSSLFRVPLNVFVVVSLMTGVASARHFVLVVCAILLLLTALVTAASLLGRAKSPPLASQRAQ